jgi:hypothetical protein
MCSFCRLPSLTVEASIYPWISRGRELDSCRLDECRNKLQGAYSWSSSFWRKRWNSCLHLRLIRDDGEPLIEAVPSQTQDSTVLSCNTFSVIQLKFINKSVFLIEINKIVSCDTIKHPLLRPWMEESHGGWSMRLQLLARTFIAERVFSDHVIQNPNNPSAMCDLRYLVMRYNLHEDRRCCRM